MENTTLFTALREFTTGLLNQLLVNLAGQDGQSWLEEFKKFLRREPCWVIVFLRRLFVGETIAIGATDGAETFVSSGLFAGGVYGMTLPVGGKPMPATNAIVFEMAKDGTFAQIFGSLGKNRRRWTEAQVCAFVRPHPEKLRIGATFFEIEGGSVADVRVDGGSRLRVGVSPLGSGRVWSAKYRRRVVVPQ